MGRRISILSMVALALTASAGTVAWLGDAEAGTAAVRWAANGAGLQANAARDYRAAGAKLADVRAQAERLKADAPNGVASILLFAGRADFAANTPLGVWWTFTNETVNRNGAQTALARRLPVTDRTTYRGALVGALAYLQENFPEASITLVTPQLDASATATNALGATAGAYAAALCEAGNVRAVGVVDFAGEAPVKIPEVMTGDSLFRAGSGTTNRAPASVAVPVAGCTLDSRACQMALSAAIAFCSRRNRAFVLGLR